MLVTNDGTYLGRLINVVSATDPLAFSAMSDSTLLLWLGREPSQETRSSLVGSIASADPLAVCIGGAGAAALFWDLLVFLSEEASPRPMMTSICEDDLGEAVAQFLQGTWPYEERMDSWNAYRVVCVGADCEALRGAVTATIAGSGAWSA
jgi:hypothetical protein